MQAALGTSAVLMNGSLWVSKKRCNRPTQSTSQAITRIHMDGLTCDLYNKMKIFKYHQEVGRETAGLSLPREQERTRSGAQERNGADFEQPSHDFSVIGSFMGGGGR